MNDEASATIPSTTLSKEDLEDRMVAVAWGLILIVTGAALALPGWTIPIGGWLTAMGVILLGLNLARHWKGFETGSCTILLGAVALAGGAGMLFGLGPILIPILMVLAGGWIVVRQLVGEREQQPA